MVIGKILTEESSEKYLNNNSQCFHTLKVSRMGSIRNLGKLQQNQDL